MCQEPVTKVGEDAIGNAFHTHSEIVELRPRDGQKHEDDVVGKEGTEHDEGRHLELLIALHEIIKVGN